MTSQEEVAPVSTSETSQAPPSGSWIPVVVRAALALCGALVITFSQDHSERFGLIVFGAFAVASGLVLAVGALPEKAGAKAPVVAQGVLTVVAGAVGLALPGGGLPFLIFLVTSWAAVTGFLELYTGLRQRGRDPRAKDLMFAGIATALLAIAVLLVPPDFAQPFGGEGVESGVLTASVIVVGAIGAYAAILGVYLAIAGFSLKWSTGAGASPERSTTGSDN